MLEYALRSLLLGRSQEKWDMVLPQIVRACRSIPQPSIGKTPNFLILGQRTRVSDYLTYHIPDHDNSVHEYVGELVELLRAAHKML